MFDDLNPEQRAAVLFGDGPLLIVAGAGTGKTARSRLASATWWSAACPRSGSSC